LPVRQDVSAQRGVSKLVVEPSAATRSARQALAGSIRIPQCLQRGSFLQETATTAASKRKARRRMGTC
jgi:hypothetical protein